MRKLYVIKYHSQMTDNNVYFCSFNADFKTDLDLQKVIHEFIYISEDGTARETMRYLQLNGVSIFNEENFGDFQSDIKVEIFKSYSFRF